MNERRALRVWPPRLCASRWPACGGPPRLLGRPARARPSCSPGCAGSAAPCPLPQVSPPKTDIENNVIISDYAQMDRILKASAASLVPSFVLCVCASQWSLITRRWTASSRHAPSRSLLFARWFAPSCMLARRGHGHQLRLAPPAAPANKHSLPLSSIPSSPCHRRSATTSCRWSRRCARAAPTCC